MENLAYSIETFSRGGALLMPVLLVCTVLLVIAGLGNILASRPFMPRFSGYLLTVTAGVLLLGLAWMGWFHWQIYQHAVLELPAQLVPMINQQLAAMNQGAAHGIPLYDPQSPPRYLMPPWIEEQRHYFWFFCFALMALFAHRRLEHQRFRASLYLLMALQLGVLYFLADPFREPLPRFFAEITPWFTASPWDKLGMFMQLYPRLEFYHTATYMWFHPPLLFISYACITIFFAVSLLMLIRREAAVEAVGYTYAKFGYFLLTLGMLLGYPWALKAWGPNWWWDPKVSSSIMLWAIFSTYLHTRIYANKKGMWYFSAALGLLCFVAMIYTFISSYLFPGAHSLM